MGGLVGYRGASLEKEGRAGDTGNLGNWGLDGKGVSKGLRGVEVKGDEDSR